MRDQTRAPRKYEMMTILHPDVTEEEIPAALERVTGIITAAGGTITETLRDSPWGRRRLAYPIRNNGRDLRDGYYTVFRFDLVPGQVDDMERDLKLDEQVIRYLVTAYSPKLLTPKEIEQAEIDAENAAAEAYAAAQAEVTRAAAAQAAGEGEAATAAADNAAAAAEQAEVAAGDAATVNAAVEATAVAEASEAPPAIPEEASAPPAAEADVVAEASETLAAEGEADQTPEPEA